MDECSSCQSGRGKGCEGVRGSGRGRQGNRDRVVVGVMAARTQRGVLHVAIEGAIGVGKSACLGTLRRAFAHDPSVVFVDEPVELWSSTGLLRAAYEGTISKAVFQLVALTTRCAALMDASARPGVRLIISERSLETDRDVFASVNLRDGPDLTAYATAYMELQRMHGMVWPELETRHIVLTAPAATIAGRMQARGREGEEHVDETYMQLLLNAHTRFAAVNKDHVHVVDASGAKNAVAAKALDAVHALVRDHTAMTASVNDVTGDAIPRHLARPT